MKRGQYAQFVVDNPGDIGTKVPHGKSHGKLVFDRPGVLPVVGTFVPSTSINQQQWGSIQEAKGQYIKQTQSSQTQLQSSLQQQWTQGTSSNLNQNHLSEMQQFKQLQNLAAKNTRTEDIQLVDTSSSTMTTTTTTTTSMAYTSSMEQKYQSLLQAGGTRPDDTQALYKPSGRHRIL
jgi:phosphoribosylanthranilate isomerase